MPSIHRLRPPTRSPFRLGRTGPAPNPYSDISGQGKLIALDIEEFDLLNRLHPGWKGVQDFIFRRR